MRRDCSHSTQCCCRPAPSLASSTAPMTLASCGGPCGSATLGVHLGEASSSCGACAGGLEEASCCDTFHSLGNLAENRMFSTFTSTSTSNCKATMSRLVHALKLARAPARQRHIAKFVVKQQQQQQQLQCQRWVSTSSSCYVPTTDDNSSSRRTVALMPGDGIGPEIAEAVKTMLHVSNDAAVATNPG